MTRRYYSSTAERTSLTNSLSSGAGTMIVAGTPGFPGTRPYTLIIDPDTINEEIVTVTAVSGTTLTVTRGQDGTTATAHDIGAVVMHGFTGRDLGEPQAHMDTAEGVHGVTGNVVGTGGAQTLTGKSMDGVDNTFTNIPQTAVTNLVPDLAAKAPLDSPTFTGTPVLPATTSVGDVSATELQHLNGVTANVQGQLDALDAADDLKAPLASPTFTGDVVLPSTTSIGPVTSLEIGRLLGVTSNIQTQIDDVSASVLPPGGLTGQVLVKASDADFDYEWRTVYSVDGSPGGVDDDSIIAVAPYPTGGIVGTPGSGCFRTYTDGVTGYQYRVHKFVYSGGPEQFAVTNGVVGQMIAVAGGGGGGYGTGMIGNAGSGGAGGVFYGSYAFGGGTGGAVGYHNLYVGAGGAAALSLALGGANGGDTTFDSIVLYGGGRGACINSGTQTVAATNGGSGGGRGQGAGVNGTATIGTGGNPAYMFGTDGDVSGGGAYGPGLTGGIALDWEGSSINYAAGGGYAVIPVAPAAYTGSGGYGGAGGAGTAGAHGVILIRYRIS